MNTSTIPAAFDLTKRAPRSPRVRLGGYVLMARMMDKGRAMLAGNIGAYHFNCPLDQAFLSFAGVEAEAVKTQLALGAGDAAMLAWVRETGARRTSWEIEQWSAFMEKAGPDLHTELHQFFLETTASLNRERGDLRGWFDLLDLDDYLSYGGAA